MAFVDGQVGYPDADTQAFIEVLHESGQHYRAAILAGGGDIDPYPLSAKEGWWIARHAARYAAGELLKEAVKVGCTPEQVEALRAKAAEVAED